MKLCRDCGLLNKFYCRKADVDLVFHRARAATVYARVCYAARSTRDVWSVNTNTIDSVQHPPHLARAIADEGGCKVTVPAVLALPDVDSRETAVGVL